MVDSSFEAFLKQWTDDSKYCIKRSSTTLTASLLIHTEQPQLYRCEPAWRWKPATFRDFDLWVVLAGRGELTCARVKHPLRAGAGLILQPGDKIEATHDSDHPLVVFACHFLRGKPGSPTHRFQAGLLSYAIGDVDFAGRCAEQATRAYEHGPAGRHLAATLVGQFVAQGLLLHGRTEAAHPADDKLASLALEIRSRPGEAWETSAMARRCGLSAPQFNRRFKRAFGTSARQYILHERVARAATLLRETELSIKEIAEALGYRDIFYFYRQFRQLLGQTPRSMQLGAE